MISFKCPSSGLNLIGVVYPDTFALIHNNWIKSKMTDNFVKVEKKRALGPSIMSYKRLQQWDTATKTILDTIFQRDRANGIISSWLMEVRLIRVHKYIEGINWNWWKCWPEEKRHKRKFRSNSQHQKARTEEMSSHKAIASDSDAWLCKQNIIIIIIILPFKWH